MRIGLGIWRERSLSPIQSALVCSIPLLRSLAAIGNATPTFSRASTATFFDHEGVMRTAKSGEARFKGMRRVENKLQKSENLSDAVWTKISGGAGSVPVLTAGFTDPDGGTSAYRLQLNSGGTTGADYSIFRQATSSFSQHLRSAWIKSNTGSNQTLYLGALDGTQKITATPIWQRLYNFYDATASVFDIGCYPSAVGGTGQTADVIVWHPQLEDVTGQSVQTPGEYQSTGVLSFPYQGAGVDGVGYYSTTLSGSNISTTNAGFLHEPARTNLFLNSATGSTQTVTAAAGSVTVSLYGTGSVTLTGMANGTLNGTGANNRVFLTVTAAAGAVLATFTGSTTNVQFEAGPNVTSYIPTTGSTASRAADQLTYSIPGLPQNNFTIAAEIWKENIVAASNGNNAPLQIGGYSVNASLTLGGYNNNEETALGSWPTVWNLNSIASINPYSSGTSVKSAWAFLPDATTLNSAFAGTSANTRTANAAKASSWNSQAIGIGNPPSGNCAADAMVTVVKNFNLYSTAFIGSTLRALTS